MGDQEREPHPPTTEARRAAARAATRRWRERKGRSYAPRRRQLDREQYAASRDSVLSAKRERYASDRDFAERVRASNRAWYQRNREKRREYNQRYWQEHGDELRARGRERNRRSYAKDPRAHLDYYKQWRLRNLERARAYVRVSENRRRAASAGQHFTYAEWEEMLRYHAGHCAYCGSTERIEADHRNPLYRGGSNDISNILPACRHCNRRKHRRTEEEFRALLQAERAAALVKSWATDWGSRAAAEQ
jgi:5-methylcytosine-specific restriction endonuclease McrA